MAGRIRTIKPELLEDAITAGVSAEAFRLFIGMILLADDYGRLRAEPDWLQCQVFWKKRNITQMAELVAELSPLVLFYEDREQKYAAIRNWSKHQKVNHPGKCRIPEPSSNLLKSSEDSSKSQESLLPDHGKRSWSRSDDPSQRESTRGSPDNDPPISRETLVDVSVTPDVAQAFAEGVSAVTKAECSTPTGKPARDLIAACAKHSRAYGDELIGWTRAKASEWAKTAPFSVRAWDFISWLDGGCKQRLRPNQIRPNGRTVQPRASEWVDDDGDRPWESAG